jgi:Heparinase II/III-like protein
MSSLVARRDGSDYSPGHAYADTLTFELSLVGKRWVVDGGCSTYDAGPERLRQRGTATNKTIVVDEADCSEVWASFRVARLARVKDLSISSRDGQLTATASHGGDAHPVSFR